MHPAAPLTHAAPLAHAALTLTRVAPYGEPCPALALRLPEGATAEQTNDALEFLLTCALLGGPSDAPWCVRIERLSTTRGLLMLVPVFGLESEEREAHAFLTTLRTSLLAAKSAA